MKTKKSKKIQKRSIEVIEYEDGTWKIIGSAWDLDLDKGSIDEAFIAWRTENIKEECSIQLKPPKILGN